MRLPQDRLATLPQTVIAGYPVLAALCRALAKGKGRTMGQWSNTAIGRSPDKSPPNQHVTCHDAMQ